jgi:hypothetical protein
LLMTSNPAKDASTNTNRAAINVSDMVSFQSYKIGVRVVKNSAIRAYTA